MPENLVSCHEYKLTADYTKRTESLMKRACINNDNVRKTGATAQLSNVHSEAQHMRPMLMHLQLIT